jgi:hypothetical protein
MNQFLPRFTVLPISFVAVSIICCFSAMAQESITWKKHVIVDNAKSSINSAQASDFDGDGHIDVIASYRKAVYILKGPDWKRSKSTILCPDWPETNREQPVYIAA